MKALAVQHVSVKLLDFQEEPCIWRPYTLALWATASRTMHDFFCIWRWRPRRAPVMMPPLRAAAVPGKRDMPRGGEVCLPWVSTAFPLPLSPVCGRMYFKRGMRETVIAKLVALIKVLHIRKGWGQRAYGESLRFSRHNNDLIVRHAIEKDSGIISTQWSSLACT